MDLGKREYGIGIREIKGHLCVLYYDEFRKIALCYAQGGSRLA